MTHQPQDEITREILAINHEIIANNQRMAAVLAEILRALARDTLTIADLALPSDDAEASLISAARRRAEKILAGLEGRGHAAH